MKPLDPASTVRCRETFGSLKHPLFLSNLLLYGILSQIEIERQTQGYPSCERANYRKPKYRDLSPTTLCKDEYNNISGC
jgi:hypothetical protein